ncbi:hypothetical protein HanXRQr2_Chr01g0024371 [Helianthus annuus]|uniref:Uncharacterized protein n=1 Tax=Helianthus annuus TaxID=4232 RepID=A0A251VIQ8_HELAN|nr:hypothetical protein HanXRQr2_Chr01g0024371 [Helianthus annuus]KAJ0627126.1 hypothetical protein HanHA89_Chr01g0021721 [Helianthus annuus]KAJ0783439.1 hypothetical protein HanLR1_Chr01g0020321 [Helianthus annuus]
MVCWIRARTSSRTCWLSLLTTFLNARVRPLCSRLGWKAPLVKHIDFSLTSPFGGGDADEE